MNQEEITFETIASVVALVAAVAALLQAVLIGAANRARVFIAFSDRYTSAEMAQALALLAKWYHDNKLETWASLKPAAKRSAENPFVAWANAKSAEDAKSSEDANNAKDAKKLNEARRLVSRYYYDAASLYELRLIRFEFARALIANNGLNIFYHICDPMNAARQPVERFERHCATLRHLRRKFGDGKVYDPKGPQPEPETLSAKVLRRLGLRRPRP